MAKLEGREEQYVLRVTDSALAERIRGILREEVTLSEALQLTFLENGRQGTVTIDGVAYPVHVLDLPSTVESYKTYDDVNLVKVGDIGQILVVGKLTDKQAAEVQKGLEQGGPAAVVESLDGITPPMKSARSRHLRPRISVPPEVVSKVEQAIIDILDGYAPADTEFEDIEEEYVVDEASGRGSWVPVTKQQAKAQQQAQQAPDSPI